MLYLSLCLPIYFGTLSLAKASIYYSWYRWIFCSGARSSGTLKTNGDSNIGTGNDAKTLICSKIDLTTWKSDPEKSLRHLPSWIVVWFQYPINSRKDTKVVQIPLSETRCTECYKEKAHCWTNASVEERFPESQQNMSVCQCGFIRSKDDRCHTLGFCSSLAMNQNSRRVYMYKWRVNDVALVLTTWKLERALKARSDCVTWRCFSSSYGIMVFLECHCC